MRNLLVFLGIGKLFIYLLQISPIPRFIKNETLKELVSCDLCLGFWIYLFLGVMLRKDIDEELESVIVSKLATASVSTFVMHLLSLGWRERFGTYIFE